MSLRRAAAGVVLPFALHGLARTVDEAVGVVLHTTLDVPALAAEALRLVDPARAALGVAGWALGGGVVWLALALRRRGVPLREALVAEAHGFMPLLLRPVLTLLALASLAALPTYPYGFTLPVALGQDWGPAQDAAALCALLAGRLRPMALPLPRATEVGFLAFLAYALLTPAAARHWESHPGNEPKTLRTAVALGHWGTLDVEGVSAGMEELRPKPIATLLRSGAGAVFRRSGEMLAAFTRGPDAVGAQAIRATRINRQTIRGKEGGVYHVLAPGPSLLLAPVLRADRALNLWRGTPGRLGLTVLFWNLLAAVLVSALFVLLREATGRPGLAALVAGACALLPPFLFYSFQFYPEMLGALVLAVALRALLFGRWRSDLGAWGLGLLLATLPWLHQKFLPLWAVLAGMAVLKAVGEMATLRALLGLLLPQAATLFLFLAYNFAVTGSARPDALFLAWGPGGVTSARIHLGLAGLVLDARYGLLPYVPAYVLAAGGLFLRPLRPALPAAAVYYLTVASADNWSGAVCNLGRYVMPALPYAAAAAALLLARTSARRGVLALALTLAAWSGLVAQHLWRDPHAANDSALLLARSALADGNVYLPNLFLRSWAEGAPGLGARLAVLLALVVLAGAWLVRAGRGRGGERPDRLLAGLAVVLLAAAFLLERWPSDGRGPRFPNALEGPPGITVFLDGPARVDGGQAEVEAGEVELLVRSRQELAVVPLRLEGQGHLRLPGRAPIPVPPSGLEIAVPVEPLVTLVGRRGLTERLYRQRLGVETDGALRLAALR